LTELLEIIAGLKNEICPAIDEPQQKAILTGNFDRALQIIAEEIEKQQNPEIQLAVLRGKVEAYEKSINLLNRR